MGRCRVAGNWISVFTMAMAASAAGATPQDMPPPDKAAEAPPPSRLQATGKAAGKIVTQPARDAGVLKTTIPPLLVATAEDPYSLSGLKNCRQIAGAISALNEVLGPDFEAHKAYKDDRAGKLAEAGGKTVVNSLLPFRGLVREVTGAAPAERRRNAAIDAGHARRGFLRGVMQGRGCRTAP